MVRIYYLDLGVNHKYEPEADAVEFCAGKVSDRLPWQWRYLQSEFRRFLEQLGRGEFSAASTVPSIS